MGDMSDPAFPVREAREYQYCGMTLRDYFAAKAMQGMTAGAGAQGVNFATCYLELLGTHAYQIADAMIAARQA